MQLWAFWCNLLMNICMQLCLACTVEWNCWVIGYMHVQLWVNTSKQISKVHVPIHNLTDSDWGFWLFHILVNTRYCFFILAVLVGVWRYSSFVFPWWLDWAPFHMFIDLLDIVFGEVSLRVFYFPIGISVSFLLIYSSSLHILDLSVE